jgi:hypothetical protein
LAQEPIGEGLEFVQFIFGQRCLNVSLLPLAALLALSDPFAETVSFGLD